VSVKVANFLVPETMVILAILAILNPRVTGKVAKAAKVANISRRGGLAILPR
jgi:hypothetical protein